MIDREELERLYAAADREADDANYYGGPPSKHLPQGAALSSYLRNAVPDILNLLTERDTLSAENARLEEANRTIAAECIKWAREAGEAKGKLEGSEAAGVVDQWREKCEQLEAENAALTAKVERLEEALRAQAQFVDDFFAPWGSWKTAWWEGWVSDHAAFSENNALKALANKARAALKGEEG